MTEGFPCELVSWATVNTLSHRVAEQIRASGFRPQVVVAIGRGGYVPARLLCDHLNLYDLRSLRIVHYIAGADKQRRARLADPLCRDLGRRRVLLVDDVSDSGDTLELARHHLRERSAGKTAVAVLHHKTTSTLLPDFFARRIIKWRWLIYPWAIFEDVSGFLSRLPQLPVDAEQAAVVLQRRHGIKVPPALLNEVLATLRK